MPELSTIKGRSLRIVGPVGARLLESVGITRVLTLGDNAPPGSPATGDYHVVGTAGTGAFSGFNNAIALRTALGAWEFATPTSVDAWQVRNAADGLNYTWSGTAWASDGAGAGSVTLAMMANIATDRLIGRDTAGTGVPEALQVVGGLEFTGTGGIQRSALTGDVTATAGSNALAIATGAVTLAMMNSMATDRLLGRDSAGTGAVEELAVSGGLEFTTAAGIQRSALTGDVTATAGSAATTIAARVVTFAKMVAIATARLLGRGTAGSGDIEELTIGIGVEITGGALQRSALTGDVTATAGSNATTIANDAVTYAKIQNVTATDRMLCRVSASAGNVEEAAFTDLAQVLVANSTEAQMRTTLEIARTIKTTATHDFGTLSAGPSMTAFTVTCAAVVANDVLSVSTRNGGLPNLVGIGEVGASEAPPGTFEMTLFNLHTNSLVVGSITLDVGIIR